MLCVGFYALKKAVCEVFEGIGINIQLVNLSRGLALVHDNLNNTWD